MAKSSAAADTASRESGSRRSTAPRSGTTGRLGTATAIMDEARRAGLLDGDKTEHLSFRAPKALIDAAKRESGATRPTELGLLALAMLAQPDPVATFLKKNRGVLGPDHQLDY
jgi:hypothetical protein